jgi:hypothetical protein
MSNRYQQLFTKLRRGNGTHLSSCHPGGMPDGSRWSFRGSRENDHRLTGARAGCIPKGCQTQQSSVSLRFRRRGQARKLIRVTAIAGGLSGIPAGCIGPSPQPSGGRSGEKTERPPAAFCKPFGLRKEVLVKRHSPNGVPPQCAELRAASCPGLWDANPLGLKASSRRREDMTFRAKLFLSHDPTDTYL